MSEEEQRDTLPLWMRYILKRLEDLEAEKRKSRSVEREV